MRRKTATERLSFSSGNSDAERGWCENVVSGRVLETAAAKSPMVAADADRVITTSDDRLAVLRQLGKAIGAYTSASNTSHVALGLARSHGLHAERHLHTAHLPMLDSPRKIGEEGTMKRLAELFDSG